ncbi:hypothetical protein PI124_g9004 [Phytophthora idaei]|nr:hypothetical protein PI125_g9746 [Phytophthora idaei]KAG3246275.1 hypothetical protein PI124_g9004 [Phytophthora idaei]
MARVDNGEAVEQLTTAVAASEARGVAGNDQPASDKNAKDVSQSAGNSKLAHDNSNALVNEVDGGDDTPGQNSTTTAPAAPIVEDVSQPTTSAARKRTNRRGSTTASGCA